MHQARKSKYPMLEVSEAMLTVIRETSTTAMVEVETCKSLGLLLAESVTAESNVPEAPISMMDGYLNVNCLII